MDYENTNIFSMHHSDKYNQFDDCGRLTQEECMRPLRSSKIWREEKTKTKKTKKQKNKQTKTKQNKNKTKQSKKKTNKKKTITNFEEAPVLVDSLHAVRQGEDVFRLLNINS